MLPLGGIALTLAALIPPGRVTGWLSGAILLGFAGSSVQLSGIWHSTEALWQTAAARYPEELRSTVAWAGAVQERDPAEARAIYETALKEHPDSPRLHTGYGNVLFALGLDKPAEAAWQYALTLDPTHKKALQNSMVQRTRTGRADEAIPLGERLVATYPMYIEGWDGLAAAYLAVQDGQGARVAAERAVALSPHLSLIHI